MRNNFCTFLNTGSLKQSWIGANNFCDFKMAVTKWCLNFLVWQFGNLAIWQFWCEIMLAISNQTWAAHSFDFEITYMRGGHMISGSAIHMIMPNNYVEPKGHEGAHIRVMLWIYSIFRWFLWLYSHHSTKILTYAATVNWEFSRGNLAV